MITQEELHKQLDYNPETGVFKWAVQRRGLRFGSIAGHKSSTDGYIYIRLHGKRYPAHRLAWFYVHGEFPPGQLDHINRTKSDNRIENLRPATPAENGWNSPKKRSNTSGFKGVKRHRKTGLWHAEIRYGGERHSLGYFKTPQEGHAAYVMAALEHHGEFANV